MTIRWTEFPDRVEKFGDLFNIFETLDHDGNATIVFSLFDKMSDKSAYTVEFSGVSYRIVPHPERIPGWEQLVTQTEREYSSTPSLGILRKIRGFISEVQDVPISAVNEMTIAAVAEAFDEGRRRPVSSGEEADSLLTEFRWLKVTEIAKLFALNAGQVSKNADTGTFVTNGKTGHDRRIDVLSVIKRELDRLNRQGNTTTRAED